MKALWKTSGIVAAAIACFYILTLDQISNIWQYGTCLVCIIYILFLLVTHWDEVVRHYDIEDDTEIVDIEEHR